MSCVVSGFCGGMKTHPKKSYQVFSYIEETSCVRGGQGPFKDCKGHRGRQEGTRVIPSQGLTGNVTQIINLAL
jgi:hypothetical protein